MIDWYVHDTHIIKCENDGIDPVSECLLMLKNVSLLAMQISRGALFEYAFIHYNASLITC